MENLTIYYSKWDGKHGSHDLLKKAAAHWCSCHGYITGHEQGKEKGLFFKIVQEDKWKKPYFDEPEGIEFSISHSGDLWMCAISDTPVGLDIQEENSCKRERISRRFFHPKETQWLAEQNYRDFFRVWAAKESYVKYIGEGLVYGMEKFCVVDAHGLADHVETAWQQHFLVKLLTDMEPEFCEEPGAEVLALCLTTAEKRTGKVRFQSLEYV